MSESLPFRTATTADGRTCELFDALGSVKGGKLFRGRLSSGLGFSKIVAIKMVDEGGAERTELGQRLRDEARLLALLEHHAIVTVDDLIQVGGRWAVVMEFVDGQDLAALLKRGPLPVRVVAEIGAEIGNALAAAHDAMDPRTGQPLGMVHRNVQPPNIRITPKGDVKLVGFGFARARFSGREAQTGYLAFDQAGFLAPERMLGQDTAAGDVYGLAASLVSALLGENTRSLSPIAGAHDAGVAELRGRLSGKLLNPGHAMLIEPLMRALSYATEARPTARALALELSNLLPALGTPALWRWAPDHIQAFAPPPPAPVVPTPAAPVAEISPRDSRSGEARSGEPRPKDSRPAEARAPTPKPSFESKPRSTTPAPARPKTPRPTPARNSRPAPPPPAETGLQMSSGRRALVLTLLGVAALTFLIGGAALAYLALTMGP